MRRLPTVRLCQYLSGDSTAEHSAVDELRSFGTAAARRFGLQGTDADAFGVDFASHALARIGEGAIRVDEHLSRSLLREAWGLARQEARRARTQTHRFAPLEEATSLPHEDDLCGVVTRRLFVEKIEAWLSSTSATDRVVFDRMFVQGWQSPEVAAAVSLTPQAVRKRAERIRRALRVLLADAMETHPEPGKTPNAV